MISQGVMLLAINVSRSQPGLVGNASKKGKERFLRSVSYKPPSSVLNASSNSAVISESIGIPSHLSLPSFGAGR
jgi:hypothetical protein